MSSIRLCLTDHERSISGEVHGSIASAAIAALSAEPETIQELELASRRFVKPIGDRSPFASLHADEHHEPCDAGIVIVDLAARVVAIDSSYYAPAPITERSYDDFAEPLDSAPAQDFMESAEIRSHNAQQSDPRLELNQPTTYEIGYHDGEKLTDLRLPYRLPDDWLFVGSVPEYEGVSRKRRAERAGIEWFDAREVLFGKQLCQFVTKEITSAPDLEAEDLFTEIHAKWLVSPRAGLQGESPRELLLEKKQFIDFDLHSRELQWSLTGECPPPLLPTAHAYRFAGFGIHETVIYYDLIRILLAECHQRARQEKNVSPADEMERLEQIKNTWLETPSGDCQGKAPALIIEWERRRIPWAMSGKEAMIDEDCPVCQAMAEDFETPMFWHLDGCEMDDQFEFSYFKTREEWEASRRRWDEFNREFQRKWKERKRTMLSNENTFVVDENEPFQ